MIETLIRLLAALGLSCLLRAPDLTGLATYYDPCLRHVSSEDRTQCREHVTFPMRNGEPFALDALTVAVDTGYWPAWANREAIVFTECGGLARVRVTDTGMLANAGAVRFGVGPLNQARYWPADRTDVKWSDGAVGLPFVADFPMGFFAERVTCEPDTMATVIVYVWVQRDD